MNYLYNGVELPNINAVYTKEIQGQYPYAVIASLKEDYTMGLYEEYVLFVSNTQPIFDGSIVFLTGTYKLYKYNSTEVTVWTEQENNTDKYINRFYDTVWCNNDILNSDGTLYLAASDPVPVNPTVPKVTLHPESFLRGVEIGRLLRSAHVKGE